MTLGGRSTERSVARVALTDPASTCRTSSPQAPAQTAGSWTMYIAWTDDVSILGRGFSYDGQGHNFVRVIVGTNEHGGRLKVKSIEVLLP